MKWRKGRQCNIERLREEENVTRVIRENSRPVVTYNIGTFSRGNINFHQKNIEFVKLEKV